ncbi:hypothetical protein CAP35_06095 [Chitinophagaceae bacterium IBVUCB1]|jgi:ligand-binding SRPBCC domain-containing protein|nr:hypothetical protein CAP35_06095 [Chitinophagaceae bacterium IBVUCB1]
MSVYKLERKQLIKCDMDTLWAFFADARNLSAITPSYMNFVITSDMPKGDVYAGQVITYKVSPLMGIPMFWMTEITHVEKNKRFVDEQRVGPYKMWHHQHSFEETPDGILMTDLVHYRLPLWILGDIAHTLFVKKQLENIFDYRYQQIGKQFNK